MFFYPAVVIDTYVMGVFEDMAGIAPGYPWIKFWRAGEKEPLKHTDNAGWSEAVGYLSPSADSNDLGWVRADKGFVALDNERGEKGGSFTFYLKDRNINGTVKEADKGSGFKVGEGDYNLKLCAVDINGKEIIWPYDAYYAESRENVPNYMAVSITATGFPPVVYINEPMPDQLYQNSSFTIKTEAAPNTGGEVDKSIAHMFLEVTGKKPDGTNAQILLKHWSNALKEDDPDYVESNKEVSFEVDLGAVYYSTSEIDSEYIDINAATKLEPGETVPDNAYAAVVFEDANFNISVEAKGDGNSTGKELLTLYIDRQRPKTEVTGVSRKGHNYIKDDISKTTQDDKPNSSIHDKTDNRGMPVADPYRLWTVNSTVRIGVNSTDNRGASVYNVNEKDDNHIYNGFMKFKYLFLKGNDINENHFSAWKNSNP